ncbi:MAG: hypothetical protein Tsb008_11230 [Rhodothalassiaceae bacterium]
MLRNTLIRALGATLLLAFGAGSASAGEAKTLDEWKVEAGRVVSFKMAYPSTTSRRNLPDSYNIVEVEMTRDGEILSASLVQQSESVLFDRASERAAKALKRLPALPQSYKGETANVRIHMLYADNERALNHLARGIVETRQIAEESDATQQTAAIDLMISGGR